MSPAGSALPTVLVLAGGPDAEHDVSLSSAAAIAAALNDSGRYRARREIIDRLTIDALARLPGDVIFPALHGRYGEGGPLQDVLESDGRPFVGSFSLAARHAMDKMATKLTAATLGIDTPAAALFDFRDPVCPVPFPAVLKPVHEGSTVGLFVCHDTDDWAAAVDRLQTDRASGTDRVCMVERMIPGRELTVGLLDNKSLPLIEIVPADGLYDYEAKYTRDDTIYRVDPELPAPLAGRLRAQTERLARVMGIRHVARADYILADDGAAWFLEINTMPGFTDHSLVPKAARAVGVEMPELCARLIDAAIRDHAAAATET